MPYCLPSPPSSPTKSNQPSLLADDTPTSPTRNHRRSRSTPAIYSPLQSNSAFAPLLGLPRRKTNDNIDDLPLETIDRARSPPKRAQFTTDIGDDDESSDDSVESKQEITKLALNVSPGLRLDHLPKTHSAPSIPFPTLPGGPPSPCAPIQRTQSQSSACVILSNGKPLKSSLKSSSSPDLPDDFKSMHLRAQSAPSTPVHYPKNVHFKDETDGDGLETVKVFNKAGKPANLNYGSAAEETETENEYDSSSYNSFPFPAAREEVYRLAPFPETSTVPSPNHVESANVFLETLTVPNSRPPLLRGSVLVRNITFSKSVAVRFTLDDWQTTSEVSGTYVTSVPTLPAALISRPSTPDLLSSGSAGWDWASAVSNAVWDRFSFCIKLEDVEKKLLDRTMFVAVRYQAHADNGGEWWDNNDGDNYRISFQLASEDAKPKHPAAYRPKVNAMFSAASSSPSFPPSTPPSGSPRNGSFPFPPRRAAPVRTQSNPSVPTFATLGAIGVGNRKSKLSLSNYIAPSQQTEDPEEEDTRGTKSKPTIECADLSVGGIISPPVIIGGMPATASPVSLSWPSSSSTASSPSQSISSLSTQPRSFDSSTTASESLPTPTASPKISPTSSAMFSVPSSNSNDTYAEFVKKWCFHQSAPTVSTATDLHASVSPPTNPWMDNYGLTTGLGPNSILAGGPERA